MRTEKFGNLYFFHNKSKIKAGEGLNDGNYPFYTSSQIQNKWLQSSQFNTRALIFGTGGKASVHFADGQFSVSTDCLAASSKQQFMNIKFVYYYLYGNIQILERGFKGAGLQHISKKYIEDIDIPVFPLEIQNKIVAVLDKANSLVSKREKTIQLLDKLLRATFLDMFQDDLIDFEKSDKKLFNITSIVSGLTKGRKTKETNLIEVPYLRVANAQDGYFDLNEIKNILATKREIEQYNIVQGDLLITEGGDPDKLGRGAVWEKEENRFIYQNHLYRLRINNLHEYSPYWLIQLISSEFGKYYFLRQAKQTTGIATINKRQVSNFPIPISSFIKQKEFEKYYLKIKSHKLILSNSLYEFNTLQNSLIQKVFNGELNFNIDIELDALIKEIDLQKKGNDLSKIISDIAYLQRLIDKLNNQEFKERDLYDKAKHAVFQLLKEEHIIVQEYDEDTKSLKLAMK